MRALQVITVLLLSLLPSGVSAFTVRTHQQMNRTAANTDDDFDGFLRNQVQLPGGRDQMFGARSVVDWVVDGGEQEDGWTPLPGRFFRHFHDPLQPWTSAGLVLPWLPQFDSSITWMQEPQGWSWQEARGFFYAALTSTDPMFRHFKWEDTFRAVGQIMHLVEDAAQPAHTRNDPHASGSICHDWLHADCGGNLEYWVEKNFPVTGGGAGFDRDILFHPTGYSQAPVPVARLIDTDTYDGNNPPDEVSARTMGVAEFSNANFFSEGTTDGEYPHPDISRLVVTTQEVIGDGTLRQYYKKGDNDGYPVNAVATASVLTEELQRQVYPPGTEAPYLFSLDEEVWRATAQIVVPKAVDYAQGVLEYFFRGRLDFCHGGRGGFSALRNTGPEPLHGVFALYYDDGNDVRHFTGQWSTDTYLPLDANGQGWLAPNAVMRVPDGDVPTDPPPSSYILVFHGDMGLETQGADPSVGAVAAKMIDAGQLCTQTLWQWNDAGTSLVAFDLGADGVPSQVSGSFTPPLPAGYTGRGVAFDPTDGNLWYTSTSTPTHDSDGMLRKVTPDGTAVSAIPVVGTYADDYNGATQTDFSAIDMDPADPHFIWISGLTSVTLDYDAVPLYQVRTSDGQVVQRCLIRRSDEPVSTSGVNVLLAANQVDGITTVLVAPNPDWQANRIFGVAAQWCASADLWDLSPFRWPTGIAVNGAGDWVMSVVGVDNNWRFERFASNMTPYWGAFVLGEPVASAPGQAGWDIALGVGSEWPQAQNPPTP